MISEHQFAASYSSYWNQVIPLCDGYWRLENMLVTREQVPISPKAAKSFRGVVNEAGFRAFCVLRTEGGTVTRESVLATVDVTLPDALNFVERLASTKKLGHDLFDEDARREAAIIALRLLHFFPGLRPTQLRPIFPGCGVISTCEGDVIEGECLYEVKAGERTFRVTDLRQLLVYSALAYSAGTMHFTSIGLFNPRMGVSWSRTLDHVCGSVAGMKAVDTLSSLVSIFSAASVSR